ncbi:MAG TPA: DUF6582 domain-containing protein [Rhizomicrobium sp.]|nr:DUF6582 domain-containing protein [Rhizomicrobium sp.]
MDLQLFIPITKIDVAQRLVYGTIAEEIPDHADEIMDYASAKPMFEAWSQDIEKASRGRSVGNLRAMHGSVAAGKLDQIHFDDDARRIATVAKVVDDAEWKKVLEGVYTGFSMGGRYARRWPDPEHPHLTRYTPEPMEVSLVDHPCIPSATFEVVKADGTIELRKFRRSAAEKDVARDAAEFADPGYQKDRKKRYPLDTEAHIRAAWGYIHHAKNQTPYTADQLQAIKQKIVAAWKAKIDKKGPPLAAGKNAGGILAKNLGDVSQLALIIDDLSQIAGELDDPSVGDGSLGSLKATIESLVALLNSLVEQATSGLANDDDEADDTGDMDAAGDDSESAGAVDDEDAGATNDDEDDDDADGDEDDMTGTDDAGAFADKLAHGALKKALAALTPRIDRVTARVADLAKRLEHLESQPMPGGPVRSFVTVTKAMDMAPRDAASLSADPLADFQRHLESLPANARAHLLTKLALRNPVTSS